MTTCSRRRWLLVFGALMALAGCGQKGPLYLPEEEAEQGDEQEQSVREPEPLTG